MSAMLTGAGQMYLAAANPIHKMEISGEKDGMEWRLIGNVANLEINRNPEYEDVTSDWSMEPMRFKSMERITLSAEFVGDPETLKILWGDPRTGPPQIVHHEERGIEALRRLLHG